MKRSNLGSSLAFLVAVSVSCGAPQGADSSKQAVTLAPNPQVNATTSYRRMLETTMLYPTRTPLARAYFSLREDGVSDLISADLTGTTAATSVRFFKNDGNGVFTEDPGVFEGVTPALVHARKAIVNDFDGDGFEDVVFAGHGYDQPPFPGERPILVHNAGGKRLVARVLALPEAFYHSVCSGDVNNDGYPDLFLTPPVFLINDGNGGFSVDRTLFPPELANDAYYTSELYDLNRDGYLDLTVTGHEQDGAVSRVLWGNSSGKYLLSQSSLLPAVPGFGVAIGISLADVTGDGIVDLLLNRTGDPSGPGFYAGYALQLIDGNTMADITVSRLPAPQSTSSAWFYWVRFFDQNKDGLVDVVVDDASSGKVWQNIGAGVFKVL